MARSAAAPITSTRVHRRARVDLLPYALAAPAVLFVLAVTVYPAIYAIQLSTMDANLLRMARAHFVAKQQQRGWTKVMCIRALCACFICADLLQPWPAFAERCEPATQNLLLMNTHYWQREQRAG